MILQQLKTAGLKAPFMILILTPARFGMKSFITSQASSCILQYVFWSKNSISESYANNILSYYKLITNINSFNMNCN